MRGVKAIVLVGSIFFGVAGVLRGAPADGFNRSPLDHSEHACSVPRRPDGRRRLLRCEAVRIASQCMARIRRWPPPPRWSRREWIEESSASAVCEALAAEREFESSRGVPMGAFIWKRVLGRMLALYRREWCQNALPERAECRMRAARRTLESGLGAELVASLCARLAETDQWLIRRVFIDNRSESSIARELGVSQQAISKRLSGLMARMRSEADEKNSTRGCIRAPRAHSLMS